MGKIGPGFYDEDSARFFAVELRRRSFVPSAGFRLGRDTFGYDPVHDAIWRLRDTKVPIVFDDRQHWFQRSASRLRVYHRLLQRFNGVVPLFESGPAHGDGTVIFPRHNATVAVVWSEGLVFKIVNKGSSQTRLIQNEVYAAETFPDLAAPLLAHSPPECDRPGYTVHEYLPHTQPDRVGEWPEVLRRILPRLRDVFDSSGIEVQPMSAFLRENGKLVRELTRGMSSPFARFARVLAERLEDRIESLIPDLETCPVWISFVHGDVVPENIRRHRDRIRLIDWGAALRTNIFYDLWRQEIRGFPPGYDPLYDELSSGTLDQSFRGWGRPYVHCVEELVGYSFTRDELHANILACCLAQLPEMLTKWKYRPETGWSHIVQLVRFLPPDQRDVPTFVLRSNQHFPDTRDPILEEAGRRMVVG